MSCLSVDENISISRNFVFVFFTSLLALISSISFEYILHFEPCNLCTLQRISFCVIALGSFIGIFSERKLLFSLTLAMFSIIGLMLSLYHLGVQFELVSDPCIINAPKSFEAFKIELFNQTTSCSKILKILGVPLSVWSFVLSSLCLIFSLRSSPLRSCK